jgi:hypothetical protein
MMYLKTVETGPANENRRTEMRKFIIELIGIEDVNFIPIRSETRPTTKSPAAITCTTIVIAFAFVTMRKTPKATNSKAFIILDNLFPVGNMVPILNIIINRFPL